jgi:hypothetical protein
MSNVESLKSAKALIEEAIQVLHSAGGTRPPFEVPNGSVGIKLPPGSTVEVVNGTMVVKDQKGNTLTGPFESYNMGVSGSFTSFMGASADGSTGLVVGPDGTIVGVAEGGVAVGIGASYNGGFGPLSVGASVFAGAAAAGAAGFKFDPSKLTLQAAASGEAKVGVEANANVSMSLGEYAQAYAEGNAFAGASVSANGEFVFDPLKGSMNLAAGFDAFAGAEASFNAGIDTALGSVNVGGHAYAGVGVNGYIDAGFEDGVLTVGAGLGVALGIGAGLDFGFSVDVGQMADDLMSGNFGGLASDIASTGIGVVGGIIEGGIDAVGAVTDAGFDAISDGFDSIGLGFMADATDTFGDGVGAVIDVTGDIVGAVNDVASDAVDAIGDALDDVFGGF